MARPTAGNMTMTVEFAKAVRIASLGKLATFWREYLMHDNVPWYFFKAAIDRRLVEEEIIDKISDALDRHLMKLFPAIDPIISWSTFFEGNPILKKK